MAEVSAAEAVLVLARMIERSGARQAQTILQMDLAPLGRGISKGMAGFAAGRAKVKERGRRERDQQKLGELLQSLPENPDAVKTAPAFIASSMESDWGREHGMKVLGDWIAVHKYSEDEERREKDEAFEDEERKAQRDEWARKAEVHADTRRDKKALRSAQAIINMASDAAHEQGINPSSPEFDRYIQGAIQTAKDNEAALAVHEKRKKPPAAYWGRVGGYVRPLVENLKLGYAEVERAFGGLPGTEQHGRKTEEEMRVFKERLKEQEDVGIRAEGRKEVRQWEQEERAYKRAQSLLAKEWEYKTKFQKAKLTAEAKTVQVEAARKSAQNALTASRKVLEEVTERGEFSPAEVNSLAAAQWNLFEGGDSIYTTTDETGKKTNHLTKVAKAIAASGRAPTKEMQLWAAAYAKILYDHGEVLDAMDNPADDGLIEELGSIFIRLRDLAGDEYEPFVMSKRGE
jgi:hypothetical protein